jgi:hypothetical protein
MVEIMLAGMAEVLLVIMAEEEAEPPILELEIQTSLIV